MHDKVCYETFFLHGNEINDLHGESKKADVVDSPFQNSKYKLMKVHNLRSTDYLIHKKVNCKKCSCFKN